MSELHAATLSVAKEGTGASRKPRWLFVDGASAFGGHEVMLLRWLEELALQRDVEAHLLARHDSQLAREGECHAIVHALPALTFGGLRDIAAVVRTIATLAPQLCVVAEGSLLAQPLFAPLARLCGVRVLVYVPMLQTAVSMGFGRGRWRDALVRRFYANVPHGWVAITHEQAQDFRAWAGVRQPVYVLPNTVARAIEQHEAIAERAESARMRVVLLGRVEAHQKGLDLLMDFAAAHPQLATSMRVSVIGTGPYEGTIRSRLAQDPALARWVSLEPWSPTIPALTSHDVLLMTSRYEGVPLVMLEAMALGVPVVAPNVAGTRAFLSPVALFDPGDIEGAFRALAGLADPVARRTMAKRNRETFDAQASNTAFAKAVAAVTARLTAPAARMRAQNKVA